jgi:hypothetical protein
LFARLKIKHSPDDSLGDSANVIVAPLNTNKRRRKSKK